MPILHVGRGEGYFYYVMELADGAEDPRSEGRNPKEIRRPEPETPTHRQTCSPDDYLPHTLREDLKQHGRLPVEQCVQIGLGLTQALAHLHKSGLVHRDVKPSNVIFVGGVPKLADIGLVASVDATRSLVGTEGYVAPEGPGTPQADLYSLGKLLYEMSTGCDRKEFPALPPDIATRPDRNALVELNAVVTRACQFDPRCRYDSAEAMHTELTVLARGQSVQRKRTWSSVRKKAAVALGALAAIAAAVFYLLRHSAPLEPSSDGPDSTNMEANAYCDKGLLILRGDNYAEVGAAYGDFTNAIRLDPNFARPYVGLLELGVREDVTVPGLPDTSVEVLRSIAQHLEHLAPRLAATHIAQAAISWSELNFGEAEHCMQEAIKANPRYEFAHTFYSWLLDCYGRTDEALAQLEISRSIAPSKVIVYRCFGNTYYVARDYVRAIQWYQKTIDWEPHHYAAWHGLGNSLLALGDYTNALHYFETNEVLTGAEPAIARTRYATLRSALDKQGIPGYWMQCWKWAESDTNAPLNRKAIIQINLGHTNEALDLLERCYTMRKPGGEYMPPLGLLLLDHDWVGLRDNPRFRKLLEEIGYTKVMRPKPEQ